jgi:hypothetical protein
MKVGAILKLWLSALFLMTGCSSRVAIDKAEFSRLQSEATIAVVTHPPEPFSFLTARDNLRLGAAAGAVGALTGGLGGFFVGRHAESLARAQGQELANANGLQDPAHKIRDGLLTGLAGQFNLNNLVPVQQAFATDDPKAIGQKLSAGTVLDFKTYEWSVMPAGMSSRYRISYRLRSRLFRSADGKILWQGDCRYDRDDADKTIEELTANSGELLRAKMDQAAEFCATTLLVQFLGQE